MGNRYRKKIKALRFLCGQFFAGAKKLLLFMLGTQFLTILIITSIDTLRKTRELPGSSGYPKLPAKPVTVDGNEITTYMDGDSVYGDMLTAINGAQEIIYFETFIWKADNYGKAFKNALIDAANRGVEVYIIWDMFGNLVVPRPFFHFPKHPNLNVHGYPLRHSGRDHRKILVVDRKIGFVGGYNIGDLYASGEWRDTHMRIVGSAVWELEAAFVDFWNYSTRRYHRRKTLPRNGAKEWNARITARLNDPRRLLFPVRGLYIDALNRARQSVYITSAYFVPDKEIQEALIAAAKRGADVKVLVPEKSNHIVCDWISRAYLTELLNNKVEVWLYKDVMIHAKTAVVDGRWSTIGTANIDRLSMTGNFEVNIAIEDRDMAHRIEDIFFTDITNSRQLTRHEWLNRPYWRRLVEFILKPLAFFV